MKPITFYSFIFLISFQISLGQNNDMIKGKIVVPDNSNSILPDAVTSPDSRLQDSLKTDFSRSNISSKAAAPILFNKQHLRYSTGLPILNIQNSAEQVTLPAFGGYYHIKSNIIFNPTNRLTFTIGGGLVRYDTPEKPFSTLKYGAQSSIQYTLTNWMKFQLYGQRLWYFNTHEKSMFIFMNPMLPQTEAGAAISTQIKNVKMDLGPKTIINTESNFQNLNMINTKISIEF